MLKLIDVHDSFLKSNKKLVLGGTNNQLNKLSIKEIKELIGKKIVLKRPGIKDTLLHVLDVDISNSIANQKNIFILVNERINPADVVKGSQICTYNGTSNFIVGKNNTNTHLKILRIVK